MQALDVGTQCFRVYQAPIYPDLIICTDRYQNVFFFILHGTHWRIGPIDVKPCFLDKRCSYDEKNQHDKNHIEHRGKVDFVVVVLTTD
jgi:hypothetical protein